MNKTMRTLISGTFWLTAATLLAGAPVALGNALLLGGGPADAAVKALGVYEIAGTTADLQIDTKRKEKKTRGHFRHTLVFQGLLIDFIGEVTCLAVDPANGRAWIGGVVTKNNSDHTAFTTEIHEPGKDVWFRVLDTGKDSEDADRTTFLGFEGAAGIITSAEYCEKRIWPGPPDDEENARTNPLAEGKIKIK